MISSSARWHQERRKAILKRYPAVRELPKFNPQALMPTVFVPVIYFLFAYLSQYLSVVNILILAWFIGSRCCFAMFKYSHELSHRLIHPKLDKRLTNVLLRYLNTFNLSTSIYLLFSFGHKAHHAGLGQHTVETAKRFLSEKHPDIELLIDRYYFELPLRPHSPPESLNPRFFNHPLRRLLSIGLFYPVSSLLNGTVIFHLAFLFKYLRHFTHTHSALYTQRLKSCLFQIVLLYIGLILLYTLAGFKGILFLSFSDLAQRGLLWHPISSFVIGSHKTWTNKRTIQPTTSLYNRWLSFVLMKMNYHVEHHDFPDIPCRYLSQLKTLAPSHYRSLHCFNGYLHLFKHYYEAAHWYYAGHTGTSL